MIDDDVKIDRRHVTFHHVLSEAVDRKAGRNFGCCITSEDGMDVEGVADGRGVAGLVMAAPHRSCGRWMNLQLSTLDATTHSDRPSPRRAVEGRSSGDDTF